MTIYGGQFTLSTQFIKPNYLAILPPTQHHSFFRNLTPAINCSFSHLPCLNTWLPLSLKLTFSSQNCYQKFSRRTACLGPCPSLPVGQGRTETFLPERKIYLSQTGVFTSPEYRSVNHAVLNIEGLKLKVTAHKTFKNKFGQIHAGIKFIYCQNTSMIGSVYSDSQLCNVWPPIRTCSFFHAAMQANVFSIEKTQQHILFWQEIHSFVSINYHN